MNFIAEINIMPNKELLDPQGRAVANNIKNLHISGIHDVRIGKRIVMQLEADSEADANAKVESACRQLLANLIMETYSFEIKALG